MEQIKKPKTQRTRRFLKAKDPRPVEDLKQALLICGHRSSSVGKEALSDLARLKYLESVVLSRRHEGLAPFEDGGEILLEHLSRQKDCGLFVVANHTKSKPHNLVFGRFFDHQIFDMVELGIEEFAPIKSFAKTTNARQYPLGSKPCFVFLGEAFHTDEKLSMVKAMFLDFFRGRVVDGILMDGLQRLIVVVAKSAQKILFRQYCISPKTQIHHSATVEDFIEVGPRFNFQLRRARDAPLDLKSAAFKAPPTAKKVPHDDQDFLTVLQEKNIGKDSLENKIGSVYMPAQDTDKIITARPKGTKRQRRQERAKRQKKQKS